MDFLFERLSPSPLPPEARLREAVLRQLQWLVGSREWLAEQEGTALIDICMLELPSLPVNRPPIRIWADRLQRLIALHEPRLKELRVELLPTGRVLSPYEIHVTGRLDEGGGEMRVRFDGNLKLQHRA